MVTLQKRKRKITLFFDQKFRGGIFRKLLNKVEFP
jgi:hypothetical protein